MGEVPERMVAFDMAATGRKFLGCACKGDWRCCFVSWVDDPWNPVLTRALFYLWNLAAYRCRNELPLMYLKFINDKSLYEPNLARSNSDIANQELVRELKSKICLMERTMNIRFSSQTNVCVAAVSVAVTLAFVSLLVLQSL